jgi:hypothetical protein
MPGYHLMETETPIARDDPAVRPPDRVGLLDFLRELDAEEADVPRFWCVALVGLEEVLYAAGNDAETLAWEIHRRLRAAAPQLEKKLATVYVLFRGRLQRGEDLWSDYRGMRIPIGHIFGSPAPQSGADGHRYYFANFNLTQGG